MTRLHTVLGPVLLLIVSLPSAHAEPKNIGLRRVVEGCEVIAVARIPDQRVFRRECGSVELELTRIIKGDIEPGKHRVTYDDSPSVSAATPEIVVFLGKGLCWRFMAQPISPKRKVADDVLSVQGFYNLNAYLVHPGLVTLRQIESFAKDRALNYTFRGPLYFPRRKQATWEASSLQLEVCYDAMTGQATVKGLPALKGFRTNPEVSVGSRWDDNGVRLDFSGSSEAPLVIYGRDLSLQPNGVINANFVVAKPDVLTPEEFKGYVADPQKGYTYYIIKFTFLPFDNQRRPRVLRWTDGAALGQAGRGLEGWSEDRLLFHSLEESGKGENRKMTRATFKLTSGEELILHFDLAATKARPDDKLWSSSNWLLNRLVAGDIPGKLLIRNAEGERQLTTFVASLEGVKYAKLDPPRTERPWLALRRKSPPPIEEEGTEPFECVGLEQTSEGSGWLQRASVVGGVGAGVLFALFAWWLWKRKKRANVPSP